MKNLVQNQLPFCYCPTSVLHAVSLPPEPTVLTSEPGDVFKIQVGTTAMLVCEASSDTAAQVTFSWTKDGQPLQLGAR